ncbi:MAG: Calx-beta domain-containing protein, partial [Anaerolineae bacterium]
GGTAVITVTRTGGSSGAVTVDYVTSDGTAVAGSDYTAVSGTLTFGDGETSKTFTVTILNDSVNDPDETVILALINATGGAVLGTPSQATLRINQVVYIVYLPMITR